MEDGEMRAVYGERGLTSLRTSSQNVRAFPTLIKVDKMLRNARASVAARYPKGAHRIGVSMEGLRDPFGITIHEAFVVCPSCPSVASPTVSWVAQLNINKIVLNKAYWTEMEAAFAYDTACDEHGVSKYKNICVPVKSQRQRINDRLT